MHHLNHKYEPPKPNGVYNINHRAMMTAMDNSNRAVTIPGYVTINTSDNIYQPNTPQRKMVQVNTPFEYADRFKTRPTGRPHIVGFDGKGLHENGSSFHDPRGVHGFFPPVKLKNPTLTPANSIEAVNDPQMQARSMTAGSGISRRTLTTAASNRSRTATTTASSCVLRKNKKRWTPPPLVLELGPLNIVRNISSARTSPGRLMSGTSDFTTRSVHSSRSHHTHPPPPVYGHLINDSNSCFSPSPRSSIQAKPTLVIGKDNPWVYRFKVKKSMNEVNKIMRNGGNRKGGNVRNGNFGLSSHNG